MFYLPQELLLEVLSRLPVKSLLRFRCVSKLWLDLIDNPHFVDLHLDRSKRATTNMVKIVETALQYSPTYGPSFNFFALEFDPKDPKAEARNLNCPLRGLVTVVGTCNGLICLLPHLTYEPTIFWNPSTHKYRHGPVIHPYINLCGFGYDQETKDYKLVVVQGFVDGCRTEACCKIYSLKSGSWGPKRAKHGLYLIGEKSVFLNGSVYWVAFNQRYNNYWVVAIDLATEEWREVLPLPRFKFPDHCELDTLGDSLYATCYRSGLWVMTTSEGNNKSWKKLISSAYDIDHLISGPLGFIEKGRRVLICDNGVLKWYDIENKRVKNVVDVSCDDKSDIYVSEIGEVFTYCESLVFF